MALDVKYSMIILCATVRRMERLFNVISYDLQNMKNVSTHTFKRHIDIWLRSIPDAPKNYGYGASVPAESNSLTDQSTSKR